MMGGERHRIPPGVWTLGFVSMFMDLSSELIHLPTGEQPTVTAAATLEPTQNGERGILEVVRPE